MAPRVAGTGWPATAAAAWATRHSGVFITAPGTEAGKTYVGCLLARTLARGGTDVGVFKPVASGARKRGNRWVSDDAERLRRAAGANDPADLITPYLYRAPVTPLLAGRLEGRPVRFEVVRRAFRQLGERHDFLIVEGAGGFASPLAPRRTSASLAVALRLPVLLVTRPELGALSQTALVAGEVRRRRLQLLGIVITEPEPPATDPTTPYLVALLEEACRTQVWAWLAHRKRKQRPGRGR